jgi:phenylacetate-CoA ligase
VRVFLKSLFRNAPTQVLEWAQIAYHFLPAGWRYGSAFTDAVKLLSESERWEEKDFLKYQESLLEPLLRHCYDNVPYYRAVFQERGITPRDIQGIADLNKLPLLTKEIVRKQQKELLARNISFRGMEEAHTSGSSGTPLTFFMDKNTRPVDRALALRKLLWLGYKLGDRIAFFKGLPLANPSKFIRYFPGARELRISFHNSDDRRLNDMLDALRHYKPDFIDAWPSCLYILAQWIEKTGRSVNPPRYILTASENLYPHVREKIEKTFQASVVDWYGQEESVAIAMQCSLARGYHIQPEMGVFELIPADRPGVSEIVGTCLHNNAMPFLRYRTGDLAVKGDSDSCPCGRKHPILEKVIGREADFVLTPERNLVSPLILDFAFYHLDEVREAQIIQEDIKTLRIRVVPWDTLSESTRVTLIKEIEVRLASPTMRMILEETQDIPRTEGGKRPFVISKLRMEDYL